MILVFGKILIQKVRSKTKILRHFCNFHVNYRWGPEKLFKTGINAQVYLLVGPGENLYMLFKRYTRSAQTVLVIYKLAITDIPADMLIKKYYHSFLQTHASNVEDLAVRSVVSLAYSCALVLYNGSHIFPYHGQGKKLRSALNHST